MASSETTKAAGHLARGIVGVWWLLSREDFAADGSRRIDPILGSDPIGILTYAPERFAAQFMKRDRSNDTPVESPKPGQNNTGAIGGYDAYFGRYEVNRATGEVVHRLEGALTPDNVGMEVSRTLKVDGDRLEIRLDTTTPEGEPITRVLTWKRIG
jgi:hypothetical protein